MRRAVGALLQRAARTTDSSFLSHEAVFPQLLSSAVSSAAAEPLVPPLPTASTSAEGPGCTCAAASPDAAVVTQYGAHGVEDRQPGSWGGAVGRTHHHGAASQAATPPRCWHHAPALPTQQQPLPHLTLQQQPLKSLPSLPAQHARHHFHAAHRCISTSAGPRTSSEQQLPPASSDVDPVNADQLSRRSQLYGALARCMTVQQLDALLADADNRAAMDEMWVVGQRPASGWT